MSAGLREWARGALDRAEADAPGVPAWRPSPGDALAGEVLRTERVERPGARPVTVLHVADAETGEAVAVWCSPAVLRTRLALPPEPGAWLAIRYDGERRSAKGRRYKAYTVAVREGGE